MSKLTPVYTALDSYQYDKAIKFASALPASNVMGKALLALAYCKNEDRYMALITLQQYVLGNFPELLVELECRVEHYQQAALVEAPLPAPKKSTKKGKKGKAAASSIAPSTPSTTKTVRQLDVIELLDRPPRLDPDTWQQFPSPSFSADDVNLLTNISVTLTYLKLHLTNFQVFLWAIASTTNPSHQADYVRRAVALGMAVCMAPQHVQRRQAVLHQLQNIVMIHLSRFEQQVFGHASYASALAAQVALWQVDLPDTPGPLLTRLAVSLAQKALDSESAADQIVSTKTEHFELYLRALRQQGSLPECLALVQGRLDDPNVHQPPESVLWEHQLNLLMELEKYNDALRLLEDHMLQQYPDNWQYWRNHMDCAARDDDLGGLQRSLDVARNLQEQQSCRGLNLVPLEVAYRRGNLEDLGASLQAYGDTYATRAACAYDDLLPYWDHLVEKHDSALTSLLEWTKTLGEAPSSSDLKERCRQLRSYIFSVKMMYRAISIRNDLSSEWMPSWKEQLAVVAAFKEFETVDQAQKESRPGDELVLLAIQQIWRGKPSQETLLLVATYLEAAIKYSPYNAYLKIAAVLVYTELNAVTLALAHYQELYIKHIQQESCSYLILDALVNGGLYEDAVTVAKGIIRLHVVAMKEAIDYTSRAIENSVFSRAKEFVDFQCDKLNKSVVTLQAKGVVLDCAPLYRVDDSQSPLGALHGLVGKETDLVRAELMSSEASNLFGAFHHYLRLDHDSIQSELTVSDTRDAVILSFDILTKRELPSVSGILLDSYRRAINHTLLIRAALCLAEMKALKKGKLTPPGEKGLARCASLREHLTQAARLGLSLDLSDATRASIDTNFSLCEAILVLVSGNELSEDSIGNREAKLLSLLEIATKELASFRREVAAPSLSFKTASRLLPSNLVTSFALIKMVSSALEKIGWGLKKQSNKPCASAMAHLAREMWGFVSDMKRSLQELQSSIVPMDNAKASDLAQFVDVESIGEVALSISRAKQDGASNIIAVLDSMLEFLSQFAATDG